MIRFLLAIVVQLLANALGLIVAAQVLDDVTLTASAFIVALVVFTVVYAIAQPFFTQMALSYVPALRGGVALIATLVGLLITTLVTDGLSISGTTTWVAATVIVWVVSLIGVLLLPLILVKKTVQENRR
jgi:putative membrane protein